uniref:Uncharacterized protein n=1 Tax=Peronospora matthiolae TaxID=2874970 RepID=A0AAV1TH39_9STRA
MLGDVESGMFALKLGAKMRGSPMTIDALGLQEKKPAAHRARSRWSDDSESMLSSLAPPRGQPPDQHRTSAQAAEPMAAPRQEASPSATHMAASIGNYEMPTTNQRKLNIRMLDGTELYKGLGNESV